MVRRFEPTMRKQNLLPILLILCGIAGGWVSAEAVALWCFGIDVEAEVVESYVAGSGDNEGWMIRYVFVAKEQNVHEGTSGTLRRVEPGTRVRIRYLSRFPSISNTASEVRLGAVAGPLLVLPVSIAFVIIGIALCGLPLCRKNGQPDSGDSH